MVRLNEIRSSNLDNLKNLTYLNAAQKFPKELMRLLYKMFSDAGLEVKQENKVKTIDRLERDLDDSLSKTNWWFDVRNNRSFEINDDIYLNLEVKEGVVNFRVTVVLIAEIGFKFNYDDKVKNIFGKLIEFSKDALNKYKELEKSGNVNIETRQKARNELINKYKDDSGPRFIKSIQRICSKYGFDFKESRSRPLSYELHYSEYLFDKIRDYIQDEGIISYINEVKLRKNVYPTLIKKTENSNYLLKDYRPVRDYVLIEFSDKKPNQKISGKNITQKERHDKIKESMMIDDGYGKEVIKQLFEGSNKT